MGVLDILRRRRNGPLDCHAVARELQSYLDGQIDDTTAARIAEHLEDCRKCGLEAETYERIKAALGAHRPEVPAESVERVREFGERLLRGDEPRVN